MTSPMCTAAVISSCTNQSQDRSWSRVAAHSTDHDDTRDVPRLCRCHDQQRLLRGLLSRCISRPWSGMDRVARFALREVWRAASPTTRARLQLLVVQSDAVVLSYMGQDGGVAMERKGGWSHEARISDDHSPRAISSGERWTRSTGTQGGRCYGHPGLVPLSSQNSMDLGSRIAKHLLKSWLSK